jgi:uncharacterized membrane protein
MQRRDYEEGTPQRLSQGLGWFSIGLGLAELSAPRTIARLVGMGDNSVSDSTIRAFGARELASGCAILAQPNHAKWVWSRVGGDVLDLSYLGSSLRSDHVDRGRMAAAMATVASVTALDVICASWLGRAEGTHPSSAQRGSIRVEEVTTINRPIEDVYRFWRRLENLPRFMKHLESVEVIDDRHSRWRAKGLAGKIVEWEAEIVQDVRDEWIAWRTIKGDVPNSGSVRFRRAPGARGTEVRVQMQYSPPAGRIGRSVAALFGQSPEQQVHEDLHRFKQLLETGEVSVSDDPAEAARSAELAAVRS